MFTGSYDPAENAKHIGLTVYNLNIYPVNADIIDGKEYNPIGLRVWDGSRWQPARKRTPADVMRMHYAYAEEAQIFVAPETGTYLFEAWGAQGGSGENQDTGGDNGKGGMGGYTAGEINLQQGQLIYVYVGGLKTPPWNGGAEGGDGTGSPENTVIQRSGGGATDFRLLDGAWNDNISLNSRILVAGGGGGSSANSTNSTNSYAGAGGGGLSGYSATNSSGGGGGV
jgi:hypothetical protein